MNNAYEFVAAIELVVIGWTWWKLRKVGKRNSELDQDVSNQRRELGNRDAEILRLQTVISELKKECE